MNITRTETISARGEWDVVVAGGGLAGCAAALAARRAGKRVLLVEKSISLGGLATLGLINLFVPMCNGRGVQIIKGMAEEFLRLSIRYGFDTIPDEWKNGEPGPGAKTRYVTKYSAPIFTWALTELLTDEGVELLFDALVTDVVMEEKHCRGLVVETKSGREFLGARIVVDATGDADVLFRAGVPTVQGGNFHTYQAFKATLESCKEAVEKGDISRLTFGAGGGGASLYGTGHPEGMPLYTGTSAESVTEYVVKNHIEALGKIKDEDRFARDFVTIPGMAQFRTTRHIDGDYTLKVEDAYRHFDDSVAAICDFDRKDFLYEVPLRTLVRKEYDNLICAGRIAAAEGYAWDVLRVIPPAILTGQAAGVAAALAIETEMPIAEVDISVLQQRLAAQNVMIHFDDALVPAEDVPAEDGHVEGHI